MKDGLPARNTPRQSSGDGGYTLLELVVVIFIVSLIAAIAYPSLSGTSDRKLKADARRISALLRYMSDSASAVKETYTLSADITNKILYWEGPEGKKRESIETLRSVELQSRGEVSDGRVEMSATPSGFREHFKFHLASGEKRMTVAFNPISGRTKISDDTPEE